MRKEDEKARQEAIDAGEMAPEDIHDLPMPAIPYVRLPFLRLFQSLMTRCSFDVGRS